MNKQEELQARLELKALVDNYATESDKDNQDYYVNVFAPDTHVTVYMNKEVAMEFHNVADLIAAYKSFGAAKEAFHMNGQQTVEFQDDTHASGIVYGMAHLVNEAGGKDVLTTHYIRYYDSYEKIDGRWLITERDQHFIFSKNESL
ncbi:nuclear transport factor 2 family protein [Streptococcus cristatus]|uniref:SnoaL-like domain-containing protein n=1 Tax=Streptococcus cristatus TaxID=45634 RepID=A0A139N4N9_STRCR|nr:nuclear transport factor 2 family protein [Streptococcus cristatus]KXT70893.1 hypothetical protein SCRDD08_00327 [Streptococcus cristatus]